MKIYLIIFKYFKKITKKEKNTIYHPKNILLTGATGFLGIHILEQLLENENGNIYCIIRDEPGITAKNKINPKN